MKRNLATFGIVAIVLVGIAAINTIEPQRKTLERLEQEQKAAEELAMAEQAEHDHAHDHDHDHDHDHGEEEQPLDTTNLEKLIVELECTNGTIVMELYPEWSPLGVAQFVSAIKDGVYDDAGFFRVVPGFVVQFGIPGDPEKAMVWEERNIQDEPVKSTNARGTITYAKSSAPNSRTTQMFINLGDNARLDNMGFSPIGKIIEGMDVVDAINAEYGEKPQQHMVTSRGNAYLKEFFPNLDYINKTTIMEAEGGDAVE